MSAKPKLFKIDPSTRESEAMDKVDFSDLGFQERRDIQEWIAANSGIMSEELLIVGKEFSGFDKTNERLDLLAVDLDGKLVVIELKRDDTGADAHWQAIKYASYLRRAGAGDIVRMRAAYANESEPDARKKLVRHLGSDDDLNALNNDQRIILVSHRFAPEVTSAVLWLNEKAADGNLITCIQLTPYQDRDSGSLYIQADTIIPVPGVEAYVIGVGKSSDSSGSVSSRRNRNQDDDITRFLGRVTELVSASLPDKLKPDKRSRWAGEYPGWRYYHMWYSQPPWGNWDMTYVIELAPKKDEDTPNGWRVDIGLLCNLEGWENKIMSLKVYDDQKFENHCLYVSRPVKALDESSVKTLSDTLKRFIEVITPKVVDFEDENNQEDT